MVTCTEPTRVDHRELARRDLEPVVEQHFSHDVEVLWGFFRRHPDGDPVADSEVERAERLGAEGNFVEVLRDASGDDGRPGLVRTEDRPGRDDRYVDVSDASGVVEDHGTDGVDIGRRPRGGDCIWDPIPIQERIAVLGNRPIPRGAVGPRLGAEMTRRLGKTEARNAANDRERHREAGEDRHGSRSRRPEQRAARTDRERQIASTAKPACTVPTPGCGSSRHGCEHRNDRHNDDADAQRHDERVDRDAAVDLGVGSLTERRDLRRSDGDGDRDHRSGGSQWQRSQYATSNELGPRHAQRNQGAGVGPLPRRLSHERLTCEHEPRDRAGQCDDLERGGLVPNGIANRGFRVSVTRRIEVEVSARELLAQFRSDRVPTPVGDSDEYPDTQRLCVLAVALPPCGTSERNRIAERGGARIEPSREVRRTADDANDGESARRRRLRSVGTSRREADDVTHRDADESGQRLRHDDLVRTTRIGESTVKDHRPSADRREPATIDQHCHGTGQVLATEVIGTEDQTPARCGLDTRQSANDLQLRPRVVRFAALRAVDLCRRRVRGAEPDDEVGLTRRVQEAIEAR